MSHIIIKYNWGNFSGLQYNIVNSGSCSISESGESVIYQSSNPYPNYDNCEVEFSCPDNQIISYQLNRFEIDEDSDCEFDYLGISCILLYRIIYKIF